MDNRRRRQNKDFYKITKKKDCFEVSKASSFHSDDVIFRIQCKDLIQHDSVLIAQQSNGGYDIYLPAIRASSPCSAPDIEIIEFVLFYKSVSEFHYYTTSDSQFNEGLLLLRIETGDSCGYWTGIIPGSFEWYLTTERVKARKNNLCKIPYKGNSKVEFVKDMPELVIKIDDIAYYAQYCDSNVYSNDTGLYFQKLGKVNVEPIPGQWYIKLISKKEESIYTFFGYKSINSYVQGAQVCFGPFDSIIETEFEFEFSDFKLPPCFLGKGNDGSINGLFICLLDNRNIEKVSQYGYSITFDTPVQKIKLVDIFIYDVDDKTKSIMSSWKLSCKTGDKILFCPITDGTESSIPSIPKILELSKYL